MIRMTLEIIPYGCEDKKETIGILEVCNNGIEFGSRYSYNVLHNGKCVADIVHKRGTKRGAYKLAKEALTAFIQSR